MGMLMPLMTPKAALPVTRVLTRLPTCGVDSAGAVPFEKRSSSTTMICEPETEMTRPIRAASSAARMRSLIARSFSPASS